MERQNQDLIQELQSLANELENWRNKKPKFEIKEVVKKVEVIPIDYEDLKH